MLPSACRSRRSRPFRGGHVAWPRVWWDRGREGGEWQEQGKGTETGWEEGGAGRAARPPPGPAMPQLCALLRPPEPIRCTTANMPPSRLLPPFFSCRTYGRVVGGQQQAEDSGRASSSVHVGSSRRQQQPARPPPLHQQPSTLFTPKRERVLRALLVRARDHAPRLPTAAAPAAGSGVRSSWDGTAGDYAGSGNGGKVPDASELQRLNAELLRLCNSCADAVPPPGAAKGMWGEMGQGSGSTVHGAASRCTVYGALGPRGMVLGPGPGAWSRNRCSTGCPHCTRAPGRCWQGRA